MTNKLDNIATRNNSSARIQTQGTILHSVLTIHQTLFDIIERASPHMLHLHDDIKKKQVGDTCGFPGRK